MNNNNNKGGLEARALGFRHTVDSLYLDYSLNRTFSISNKKLDPLE